MAKSSNIEPISSCSLKKSPNKEVVPNGENRARTFLCVDGVCCDDEGDGDLEIGMEVVSGDGERAGEGEAALRFSPRLFGVFAAAAACEGLCRLSVGDGSLCCFGADSLCEEGEGERDRARFLVLIVFVLPFASVAESERLGRLCVMTQCHNVCALLLVRYSGSFFPSHELTTQNDCVCSPLFDSPDLSFVSLQDKRVCHCFPFIHWLRKDANRTTFDFQSIPSQ